MWGELKNESKIKGSSTIANTTKINVGESSKKAAFSVVSRARHCVQDAQIMIRWTHKIEALASN